MEATGEDEAHQPAQLVGWGADLMAAANASTFQMEVAVTDPRVRATKKKLGRTKQTILFRLNVETDIPKYTASADAVYRRCDHHLVSVGYLLCTRCGLSSASLNARLPAGCRYTQFRWLHLKLGEKYPGVARPPFPAKLKVRRAAHFLSLALPFALCYAWRGG